MENTIPLSVYRKQVDLLYQRVPASLMTSVIISVCFLFFLRTFPEPHVLQVWVAYMMALVVLRAFVFFLYRKSKKRDFRQTRLAERIFLAGVVLSGLGWGSVAWWLYPLATEQSTQVIFFVVVVGVAAAAIPTLSYRRLHIQIFVCLTILPMLIGLYNSYGNQNLILAFIAVVYTAFIIKSGCIFQEHHEEMLVLKEASQVREKQLKVATKEAKSANRAKSRFLANMSHEIRTPMNAIIGRTRLALDETSSPELQAHLETIQNASENLLSLINDILDFSKIEAGELKISNKPFDLFDTLRSLLNTVRFLADDEKGLNVTLEIADDVPRAVVGDSMRLRQILLNLVNNAIKFTETGCVDVRVACLKAKEKTVLIQFSVSDTGIGIALDNQEAIFNEFVQEDDSTTKVFGGTGLGLAICKHLCDLMGGQIAVSSIPGKGSTFTLSSSFLCCNFSELPDIFPQVDHKPMSSDSLNILLVEDNEANRVLAGMVLAKAGHTLVEACNGIDALNCLVGQSYDVVLMDVQMPIMDGLKCTRIIRAAELGDELAGVDKELADKLSVQLRGCHTLIVAMTANAMSGDREDCLDSGMDEYITKPFYLDDLNRVFSVFVEGKGEIS